MYSSSHVRPTYQFLLSCDYRLWVVNIWSHLLYLKQSLRMCSITWPVHRRSPKTTRANFLPRIAYSLYNFYGVMMTIKGSLYWSIPMLKLFLAAKKTVQSKSVHKIAVFWKFKSVSRKDVIETPKRHFLTRNDVIWRILRKYPFRAVGCSLIEEPPKKEQKTSHPRGSAKSRIWGAETLKPIATKFCMPGAAQDVINNHACQFWWRSVKGFWRGEGSNFGLFH